VPSPPQPAVRLPEERLNSWKEIAAHLNCGERTAKRWEKTRGLPVRRLPGGPGLVFALTSEIDAWHLSVAGSEDAVAVDSEQAIQPVAESEVSFQPSDKRHRSRWIAGAALACISAALVFVPIWHSHRNPATNVRVHVPTQSARNLYLSGRFYWNKRTPADLQLAMHNFQAAAALDSQYAEAFAGIADCYALSPEFAAMPPAQAYPKMLEAAQRSIALDPNLAEAHRALGFVLFYWNWDRAGSRREFERALALDDHNATTYHWFANVLLQSQDRPGALRMIDKARELDPTSPSLLADRGLILYLNGEVDQAFEIWTGLERSDPTYLPSRWYKSREFLFGHQPAEYLVELRAITQITHTRADADKLAACEQAFLHHGEDGLLQVEADEHIRGVQQSGVGYLATASVLELAHRKDAALDYIQMAYERRDPTFPTLANPDAFPDLVGTPRFDELRSRSLLPFPQTSLASVSGAPAPVRSREKL
jgi:tetratricopeptide (TPR) repeat protein